MGRKMFLAGMAMAVLILFGCQGEQAGTPVGGPESPQGEMAVASPVDNSPNEPTAPAADGSGEEPAAAHSGEPSGEQATGESMIPPTGDRSPDDPVTAPTADHPTEESTVAPSSEKSEVTDPSLFSKKHQLPDGFVYVDEHIPGILLDIRYFGEDNFVGARVDGYNAPFAILTKEAADALANVQAELAEKGYTLLIYDAYRPQKAVNHFIAWSKDPEDTKMKERYYPDQDKSRLFKLGYIASRSGHSRGSTVDLTVVDAATGEPLDMGGTFDFFGEVSHHDSPLATEEQAANRQLLRKTMEKYGFKAYEYEWWHYTLADEPYPDTYFDFDVE